MLKTDLNIISIIPARSGSKGVPGKNQRYGPIAQLVDRQAISQNLHNPNLVKSSTSDSLRRVSSYETCVVAPRGIGNLYLRAVVHVS